MVQCHESSHGNQDPHAKPHLFSVEFGTVLDSYVGRYYLFNNAGYWKITQVKDLILIGDGYV